MLATSALHASVVLRHDLLIERDAEVKLNNEWLISFPTGKDVGNLIKLGNGIVNEFPELVEGTISMCGAMSKTGASISGGCTCLSSAAQSSMPS